jgi:hypothetical protein
MQTEGKTLLLIVKGRIVQIADDTPTADDPPVLEQMCYIFLFGWRFP